MTVDSSQSCHNARESVTTIEESLHVCSAGGRTDCVTCLANVHFTLLWNSVLACDPSAQIAQQLLCCLGVDQTGSAQQVRGLACGRSSIIVGAASALLLCASATRDWLCWSSVQRFVLHRCPSLLAGRPTPTRGHPHAPPHRAALRGGQRNVTADHVSAVRNQVVLRR